MINWLIGGFLTNICSGPGELASFDVGGDDSLEVLVGGFVRLEVSSNDSDIGERAEQ